jgi:hypothetical protein
MSGKRRASRMRSITKEEKDGFHKAFDDQGAGI